MSVVNINGSYCYRSLLNDKNIGTEFNDLEFGRGIMHLIQQENSIEGTFDMGPGYQMSLKGAIQADGQNYYLKMTGYGIAGTATDKWVYDYFGLIVPVWPDAVSQVPTITGTVIRTVAHGSAPAGFTATFYMVLTS